MIPNFCLLIQCLKLGITFNFLMCLLFCHLFFRLVLVTKEFLLFVIDVVFSVIVIPAAGNCLILWKGCLSRVGRKRCVRRFDIESRLSNRCINFPRDPSFITGSGVTRVGQNGADAVASGPKANMRTKNGLVDTLGRDFQDAVMEIYDNKKRARNGSSKADMRTHVTLIF